MIYIWFLTQLIVYFNQELDMCLWNMDAPGGNKVKIWQKSLGPTCSPCPTPRGMWCQCEEPLDELTVQVWLLYLHPNVNYWTLYAGRNYGQTDGQTNNPITRCPQRTFQAGGIKIYLILTQLKHFYSQDMLTKANCSASCPWSMLAMLARLAVIQNNKLVSKFYFKSITSIQNNTPVSKFYK